MNPPKYPNIPAFLTALLVLTWLPLARAQFDYVIDNGAVTITGYSGPGGNVSIPASTNGYPVTAIGDGAFHGSFITNVIIPDSVTNIGENAFNACHDLMSVTIGNSVATIGSYAFFGCAALASVTIPNSVITIDDNAFDSSGLTSVTIGNNVTTIGSHAFVYCAGLTNVTIPASVTAIGDYAFYGCAFLVNVSFLGNAPTVNGGPGSADTTVFGGEAGTAYYLPGATGWVSTFGGWPAVLLTTPVTFFTFTTNSGAITITSYNINGGLNVAIPPVINGYPVKSIGYAAFQNLTTITNVTIPNGVTTISSNAFDSSGLTSVTIPDSVTSIGSFAFKSCYGLTNLTVGNGVTTIGDFAFYNCSSLPSVAIPNAVTTIGDYAFYNCSSLTSVMIGNSVTNLGNYTFAVCSSLTNVTIGNSVTTVGDDAFGSCVGLKKVMIPNSVRTIGDLAFFGCSSLTNVMVGNSVTNLGVYAFADCSSLKSVYFLGDVPTVNGGLGSTDTTVFNSSGPGTVYYFPVGLNWGVFFGGWSTITTTFTFIINNNAITITGYHANDKYVVIPPSINGYPVTAIGGYVFYYHVYLTSVTIPDSVTTIGDFAFWMCSSLTNVTIGNSVATIGSYAFYNCSGLTSVTIGNGVTTIGSSAFYNCSGLTSVTIGNSVTNLGNYTFAVCSSLTSVTIPNSVTSLDVGVFQNCSSLHQAYFQGNAPLVNGGAGSAESTTFAGESGTVFYTPGTTGWGSTFGGWPTAAGVYQPQPQILDSAPGFGVYSNQFSFTISWATNTSVIVSASTNLQNWVPVSTNALVNGTNVFSDSDFTNYSKRFYRVRSP